MLKIALTSAALRSGFRKGTFVCIASMPLSEAPVEIDKKFQTTKALPEVWTFLGSGAKVDT